MNWLTPAFVSSIADPLAVVVVILFILYHYRSTIETLLARILRFSVESRWGKANAEFLEGAGRIEADVKGVVALLPESGSRIATVTTAATATAAAQAVVGHDQPLDSGAVAHMLYDATAPSAYPCLSADTLGRLADIHPMSIVITTSVVLERSIVRAAYRWGLAKTGPLEIGVETALDLMRSSGAAPAGMADTITQIRKEVLKWAEEPWPSIRELEQLKERRHFAEWANDIGEMIIAVTAYLDSVTDPWKSGTWDASVKVRVSRGRLGIEAAQTTEDKLIADGAGRM